jgi:hypothetical protein
MRRGEDRNAGDPGGGERIGLGRGKAGWLAASLPLRLCEPLSSLGF